MRPAKLIFDPEYALPLQAYRDPAWLAAEMSRIWRRDWVFAATDDICGSARATATGGSTTGGDDYLLVSLPPGFVGLLDSGSLAWQSVYPIDVGRCTVRTGIAYEPGPNELSLSGVTKWLAGFASAAAYPFVDFLPEDKAICERVQRGATGDFKPGRLVPIERVVADFGRYLDWRLNGVKPPGVHVERTIP